MTVLLESGDIITGRFVLPGLMKTKAKYVSVGGLRRAEERESITGPAMFMTTAKFPSVKAVCVV
jgi:hypothetical protein